MSTLSIGLFASLVLSSSALAAPRIAAVNTEPPRAMASATGPGWDAFHTRWGGRWTASVDSADGTPRFWAAPGLRPEHAADVAADIARLGGVLPSQFDLDEVRSRPFKGTTRRTMSHTRVWKGAPVVGDEIVLIETAGRIGAVWSRVTPIRGLPDPIAGEMVVRLEDGSVALARPIPGDGVINWTDRFGEVVLVETTQWNATLNITHEERQPGDPLVTHPARFVRTHSGAMSDVTDDAGTTSLTGTLRVTLDGPRLTVLEGGAFNVQGAIVGATIADVSGIDDGDLTGGTDVSFAVADVTHHFHQLRDWLALNWTDAAFFSDWNSNLTVFVDPTGQSARCNAFFSSRDDTIVFGAPWGSCVGYARVADVIYHESGHRIHAMIRYAGQTAGNIGEGSSDYVSATMNNDPVISDGAGGNIRQIAADHVYPDDFVGESHEDGLIWASFLWDLREQWSAVRPATGVAETDALFLEALAQGPTLLDAWRAVLVADDDDGDLTNGTPNDCELLALLDEHGIGPSAQGLVTFSHEPLAPQASATEGYPVLFSAPPLFPLCGGAAPEMITLRWTTDPGAGLPAGGDDNAAWSPVELVLKNPALSTYEGVIPRVPANSHVRYFVEAETTGGTFTTSHQGAFDRLWSFWVGDRRQVWCDDLEGDTSAWTHATGVPWSSDVPIGSVDDWEFGSPAVGAAGEADTAPSGATIAATALDGPYNSNSAAHLLTPEVDLSARGVMRLVSFQRWLSVEDGFYDRAGIWGQSTGDGAWRPVWTNQPTSTRDRDIVDTAWSLREYDLGRLLDEIGTHDSPLRLAFTLETDTDPTTNYGGWALDDACVIELDRPEEHFRVSGIGATTGEAGETGAVPVTLTWTIPWVRPITAVAVVVKSGESLPTSRADGVQVATLSPAAPGETMTWEGSLPAGTWTLAVLLNGRGGADWWEEAVDGVNAITLVGDGGGEGEGEVKVDEGCGCALGETPAGGTWLVGALALVGIAIRRKRARALVALAFAASAAAFLAGCAGDSSSEDSDAGDDSPALPDAGPDLLPAVEVVETCGPWAAYVEGRSWITQGTGFGGALITTTAVVSFDAESGEIAETVETVDETGDPFSASANGYLCTEDGLAVVSRAASGGFTGARTDTFDPPLLVVPRTLEIGGRFTSESTRTRENSMGTTETDVSLQYDVLYEQVVAPPGGLFNAVLVETTDVLSGNVTERAWRAPGTGLITSVRYFDLDGPGGSPPSPGFATELLGVEDP